MIPIRGGETSYSWNLGTRKVYILLMSNEGWNWETAGIYTDIVWPKSFPNNGSIIPRSPEASPECSAYSWEKREEKSAKFPFFKGASTGNDEQYTLHIPLSVMQSGCPSNHWAVWDLDLAVWSGGKEGGIREHRALRPLHNQSWAFTAVVTTFRGLHCFPETNPDKCLQSSASPRTNTICPKFKDRCSDWILYLFFSPQTCSLSCFPFTFISALFFLTSEAFTLLTVAIFCNFLHIF